MLPRDKHTRYFLRVLTMMPEPFTAYDSSHTAMVYFCVAGLALLDELPQLYKLVPREDCIKWVYRHLVDSGEGFRASLNHEIPQTKSSDQQSAESRSFDGPTLGSTYFCLALLIVLQDKHLAAKIDGKKIMNFVKNCQNYQTGCFSACYDLEHGTRYGEEDVRQAYIAVSIQSVLIHTGLISPESKQHETSLIDAKLVIDYIMSTISYDGGFSDCPGNESHGGLTYCCLAALSLLNEPLTSAKHAKKLEKVTRWLCNRQIDVENGFGARNGRINKTADSCYSFWVGASLAILGKYHQFSDAEAEKQALLNRFQSGVIGGFCKVPKEYPDPLHSFLSLCALSIIDHEGLGLKPLDIYLCIPRYLYEAAAQKADGL